MRALRSGTALIAGVGVAVAFPRPGWSLLLIPALALLFFLLCTAGHPRRGLWEGGLAGFACYALLLRWFAAVLLEFTTLGPWVAATAVVLSGVILAIFWAGIGWLAATWSTFVGPGRLLALCACWFVGAETLRTWVPFPFPWGTFAAAFVDTPLFFPALAGVGATGVSLYVCGSAAVLAYLVLGFGRTFRVMTFWVVLTAMIAMVGVVVQSLAGSGRTVSVALLQGSMNGDEYSAFQRLEVYESLTREAAGKGAQLVVWPESATGYQVGEHEGFRRRLEGLSRREDVDLIINSVTRGRHEEYYNSAVLIRGDRGLTQVRPKRVLVPFGEYLPLRFLLGEIPALAAEVADFSRGDKEMSLRARELKVGALVCYEAIFPALVWDMRSVGAGLLVNMTNDSWFGWSSGPLQHLAEARLRAAESGLPLVRAANNGISVIVDRRGREVGRLSTDERGVLVADVETGAGWAPGLWVGRVVSGLCATLTLVFLAVTLMVRPRDEHA